MQARMGSDATPHYLPIPAATTRVMYIPHNPCFQPQVCVCLTLANGPSSAGLCETVALSHWAAETNVHKELSSLRQRSSPRQQHSCIPTQQ